MNHSESRLRTNPRIVPPDLLLKFGYSPSGGIEFDSAAQTLSFYQGGTKRVDINSFGLAVRNGEGLVVGHTAQIADFGGLGALELQVLGTAAIDSSMAVARWSASAGGPAYVFGKSRNATIGSFTIVQIGDTLGSLTFTGDDGTSLDSTAAQIRAQVDGTPGANDMPGRLILSTTADGANNPTEALRIDSSQNVQMRTESYLWIGPDSAATGFVDANTTVGLVINQEANDDEVITLKSSDVAQGITNFAEADTFGAFAKTAATGGGLTITGFSDTDIVTGNGTLTLRGFASDTALDTTKTTAAHGGIDMVAAIINGTSVQIPGANENLMAIIGSGTARFIFDADGDSHQDVGTAWTNFDDEPDALIARSLGIVMDQASIVRSQWDDWGRNHKEDLIRTGIIPRLTAKQESNGEHALVNTSQVMRLHNGAIWQNYTAHMSLVERVDELEGQLAFANRQLAALTA